MNYKRQRKARGRGTVKRYPHNEVLFGLDYIYALFKNLKETATSNFEENRTQLKEPKHSMSISVLHECFSAQRRKPRRGGRPQFGKILALSLFVKVCEDS